MTETEGWILAVALISFMILVSWALNRHHKKLEHHAGI